MIGLPDFFHKRPGSLYIDHEGITEMDYTYIVKCRDGTLYTGWTNDLEKRLRAHNSKKGARYTRSRTPVELVYYESFDTKSEAMKREYQIKQMSARQKRHLIDSFIKTDPHFPDHVV